jgi:hypothetical protein
VFLNLIDESDDEPAGEDEEDENGVEAGEDDEE